MTVDRICRLCGRTYPLEGFARNKNYLDGLDTRCKKCYQLRSMGMTLQDWEAMHLEQGGKCAACGVESDNFHIDHDHRCCPNKRACSKCIRGLLCAACNMALGFIKDSPEVAEKLAHYLRRTMKPIEPKGASSSEPNQPNVWPYYSFNRARNAE